MGGEFHRLNQLRKEVKKTGGSKGEPKEKGEPTREKGEPTRPFFYFDIFYMNFWSLSLLA